MNLYEFIKMNNFKGLKISLIKKFALQILMALVHWKKNNVIHWDLKPENILLKRVNKSWLKVIDFGSGCFKDSKIYTYIQSRFYRAPEIVLGVQYGVEIDMWSFGCILYELLTGVPLFACESEQDLILRIQEYRGLPPKHLLEESSSSYKYYDGEGQPLTLTTSRGQLTVPGNKEIIDFEGMSRLLFLYFRCCRHSVCRTDW